MTIPGWTLLICGPGASLIILYIVDPLIRRWCEWRAQRAIVLRQAEQLTRKDTR